MTATDLAVEVVRRHPLLVKALGALMAFWALRVTSLTDGLWKLLTGLVVVTTECDNDARNVVLNYLSTRRSALGLQNLKLIAYRHWVKSRQDRIVVFKRSETDRSALFFYRGAPIAVLPGTPKTDNTPEKAPRIMTLRGLTDLTGLLIAAGETATALMCKNIEERWRNTTQYRVRRHTGTYLTRGSNSPQVTSEPVESGGSIAFEMRKSQHLEHWVGFSADDVGEERDHNPLRHLALTHDTTAVINRIKFWWDRKEWYGRRGLDWRLGILLHGEPGTGKTSLARAIAKDLDVVLHTFDLSSMDNADFEAAWRSTKNGASRIILLEDFDAVFRGRVNQIKGSPLTFDSILNTIAGIEPEHGLLLVVTTNDISAIDPALGNIDPTGKPTRPGRIDLVFEVRGLDEAGRRKVASRILIDDPDTVERIVVEGAEDTAAQFTDRCITTAIQQLWTPEPKAEAAE